MPRTLRKGCNNGAGAEQAGGDLEFEQGRQMKTKHWQFSLISVMPLGTFAVTNGGFGD